MKCQSLSSRQAQSTHYYKPQSDTWYDWGLPLLLNSAVFILLSVLLPSFCLLNLNFMVSWPHTSWRKQKQSFRKPLSPTVSTLLSRVPTRMNCLGSCSGRPGHPFSLPHLLASYRKRLTPPNVLSISLCLLEYSLWLRTCASTSHLWNTLPDPTLSAHPSPNFSVFLHRKCTKVISIYSFHLTPFFCSPIASNSLTFHSDKLLLQWQHWSVTTDHHLAKWIANFQPYLRFLTV